MYTTSTDPRFVKNREALQQAYIALICEKDNAKVSVTELTERAGVNRMTFYSHYDSVSDVLAEFIDMATDEIFSAQSTDGAGDFEALLEHAACFMEQHIEFYRKVADTEEYDFCWKHFRHTARRIFEREIEETKGQLNHEDRLRADVLASGLTYASLDWLLGEFGELSLGDVATMLSRLTKLSA